MEKTCARCSQSFSCNQADIKNCFCQTFTLTTQALQHLSVNYNDCLCNKCLIEVSENLNQATNAK